MMMMHRYIRRCGALAVLTLLGVAAMPGQAQAWWHGYGWRPGFFIGIAPPAYYPPPVYYPRPAYYAPPPVYYPQRTTGQACQAGAYVCPLDRPGPIGSPCSCPANRGRVEGHVG